MLDALFKLKENNTTVGREMQAGLTTFAAMAYILAVNPAILANAGMDKGALVTVTALKVVASGLTDHAVEELLSSRIFRCRGVKIRAGVENGRVAVKGIIPTIAKKCILAAHAE